MHAKNMATLKSVTECKYDSLWKNCVPPKGCFLNSKKKKLQKENAWACSEPSQTFRIEPFAKIVKISIWDPNKPENDWVLNAPLIYSSSSSSSRELQKFLLEKFLQCAINTCTCDTYKISIFIILDFVVGVFQH